MYDVFFLQNARALGILHALGMTFCQRMRFAYLYSTLSGLFALHAHLRFVENRRIQLALGRLRGIMLARTIAGHSLGTLLLAHIIITSSVELDADSIATIGNFGNQSLHRP
jgi:hypothetical protein